MEDDNGLELSLGLSCGGSSGKSKGNNIGSSSDNHRAEGGDRSSKVIDDFKNFLQPSPQKQELSSGSQKSDSGQPPQNFFSDLSKAPTVDVDGSTKPFWVEEEARKETGNKRKFFFPEMNHQKKHEKDAPIDLHEKKTKTSHISIATDEGSTAENEDVAESEVGGSSDVVKGVHSSTDANVVDLGGGQKKNHYGSSVGEEFTIGNMSYGVPFTAHHLNATNSPYPLPAKEANSNPAALISGNISGHAAPNVMQPVNTGTLPIMFGYSPVQLPMLDKDGSWGLASHSQQIQPPYAARGASNAAVAKGEGKQPAAEEGSSNQAEDVKGSSTDLRTKDASERLIGDASLSFDFSAIKPGIAADLKFGGSGTRPNLPWVSTTGSGPHGRTISGVTYRYNANQIRIVCACHGSHMSPEEFVRHASEEYVSSEASIGLTAASAHS